ncbi:MAG: anaerobic ribonucleoside-triphosphate reductase, partial [Malacoplasma sp.]|nr:anaerobic ribonucleoside-triphosphate reductase [Malacoplasma sp.]
KELKSKYKKVDSLNLHKTNRSENAANRHSYVGAIYNYGEKLLKNKILDDLPKEWAELHRQGYIHIHDLDAYGLTYNCLTFDIANAFPYENFENLDTTSKIVAVFDFLKELFAKMGNEQSGGMALANFDIDFANIFAKLNVDYKGNESLFYACIHSLVLWCNNIHTRMGQTSYYVTFNVGLGTSDFARFLTATLIESFYNAGEFIYKPNIVFKVHKGISRFKQDPNYDLLEKALLCTAKKMIPTYLLCDCEADKNVDPLKLSIMGCRTRVVDDVFGIEGAIGRGNIDNISINLPRLAFEANAAKQNLEEKISDFKQRWNKVAELTKDILLDRYYKTLDSEIAFFSTNLKYKLWCQDINEVGLAQTLKHGTLSIGFIGLSEAIEILTGNKFWKDDNAYKLALDLVKLMRDYIDAQRAKYHLNFSLLATSGELISGRFMEFDKRIYSSPVFDKGYYTNSFHIDVDSKLPAYKKLQLEGPFHLYSNGGCISYIELIDSPLGNAEGLDDLVEIAINSGVHYLGFNFPKDVCQKCGDSGVFDICPTCKSTQITRIRRVSGYLEIQDHFTSGKMNESKNRKAN